MGLTKAIPLWQKDASTQGVEMRDTVKIFERTAAAILVSWIFIYGLGYAQTTPCDEVAEACCESKLFGKHYRATDFTPSFRDLPGLLYHGWTPRAAAPEARHAFSSGNRFRATRTVPIYILKQSFIC